MVTIPREETKKCPNAVPLRLDIDICIKHEKRKKQEVDWRDALSAESKSKKCGISLKFRRGRNDYKYFVCLLFIVF